MGHVGDVGAQGNLLDFGRIVGVQLFDVVGGAGDRDAAVGQGQVVGFGRNHDVGAELVNLVLDVGVHGPGDRDQGDHRGHADEQAQDQEEHLGLAALEVVERNIGKAHRTFFSRRAGYN